MFGVLISLPPMKPQSSRPMSSTRKYTTFGRGGAAAETNAVGSATKKVATIRVIRMEFIEVSLADIWSTASKTKNAF